MNSGKFCGHSDIRQGEVSFPQQKTLYSNAVSTQKHHCGLHDRDAVPISSLLLRTAASKVERAVSAAMR